MDVPDVRYARRGDLAVAYSVSGGGPIDIVLLAMMTSGLAHSEPFLGEIEEFLAGVRRVPDTERVLATVVFTDIVGSTERATSLGDRGWRDLLEMHHTLVRRELEQHRGREVNTTGDGFLATFDGTAPAIRCALAIRDAASGLEFADRGEHELKGVPGLWRLYSVVDG
jgi:class 3 adenylate cyclase